MSSHKEAPGISNDPAADNTDVYAFVSPDSPDTVTLIANFVPLEDPAGGPNFFEFGDDVLYEICVDNNGDGVPDVTYQFRFTTTLQNPNTFLYNTGPIASLTDPHWNRRQTYTVSKVARRRRTSHSRLGPGVPTVQHWSGVDPELPHSVGQPGRTHAVGQPHGIRGATG